LKEEGVTGRRADDDLSSAIVSDDLLGSGDVDRLAVNTGTDNKSVKV